MPEEIIEAIKEVITENAYEAFHHYRIQKTDLEDIAVQIYNVVKEGFDDED